MSGKYAERTTVPADRSRAEIERILSRYGADTFGYVNQRNRVTIMFEVHGRRVRFDLPLPSPDDPEFRLTPTRKRRSDTEAERAYEQAIRQRWRALSLVIKAKLEAIETGLVTFEEEFLAHLVLPAGSTVGQWLGPQIARVYDTGQMPPMLPGVDDDVLELGTGDVIDVTEGQ